MNIGELDEKIYIYGNTKSMNRLGETEVKPILIKTVWAKVVSRTGSLLAGRPADTMLSKTTHAVTVRAKSIEGITYENWIEWTDITGVKHRLDIDYIMPPVRTSPTTTIYVQEVI